MFENSGVYFQVWSVVNGEVEKRWRRHPRSLLDLGFTSPDMSFPDSSRLCHMTLHFHLVAGSSKDISVPSFRYCCSSSGVTVFRPSRIYSVSVNGQVIWIWTEIVFIKNVLVWMQPQSFLYFPCQDLTSWSVDFNPQPPVHKLPLCL